MGKSLRIVGERYRQYEEITFLRGWAIITIVLMHYLQRQELPQIIKQALSIGGTGVHIFFFCSGLGLYLSYLNKQMSYLEFLKKRFVKVYIPYIAIVAISALVPYMYSGNRIRAFLAHVFLYKMFIPEYESSFGTQLWYISTLFQFYLVFIPLVKIRERVRLRSFFAGSLFISIFWWIISVYLGISDIRVWGSFFLQYLWEFVLGMVVAEHLWRGNKIDINSSMLLKTGFVGVLLAGGQSYMGASLLLLMICLLFLDMVR